MKILAIETSCDETSASVLTNQNNYIEVLSSVTATSLLIHAKTGGIIPENAARMQVKYIIPVIVRALIDFQIEGGERRETLIEHPQGSVSDRGLSDEGGAKQDPQNWETAKKILQNSIDAIAVTYGPGLIGSLLVGIETAKTLSFVFEKPIIPVNHLLAHIYANFISNPTTYNPKPITFPFIGLIVSGGHTDLLLFERSEKRKVPSEASGSYISSTPRFTWLGGTRDDAAGEAFDKIGRLLDLSYPAGPEIERRSTLVKNSAVKFQSPMIYGKDFDFSFSGLKAEVMRYVKKNPNMTEELTNQICFATQKAILDVLIKKTLDAAEKYNVKTILVGGGVSANQTFRKLLEDRSLELGISVSFPEKQYSTDNAAMIGAYALMNLKPIDWQKVNANPELYFA